MHGFKKETLPFLFTCCCYIVDDFRCNIYRHSQQGCHLASENLLQLHVKVFVLDPHFSDVVVI